jgi:hypothetical protein
MDTTKKSSLRLRKDFISVIIAGDLASRMSSAPEPLLRRNEEPFDVNLNTVIIDDAILSSIALHG